ncbi:class II fructose-bisphosphate aldolase, partial [Ornithobacterium rhinotracheale]
DLSVERFKRMAKMGMTLEIELGITGGEEDGVDNTDVDDSKLYTQPEELLYAYDRLNEVSDRFTITAALGNVHGVYQPGTVTFPPKLLEKSQKFIEKGRHTGEKQVKFVFHGGSGSDLKDIREAIGYGVVKMNIDTDQQYAFMTGIRDYFKKNEAYLQSQI